MKSEDANRKEEPPPRSLRPIEGALRDTKKPAPEEPAPPDAFEQAFAAMPSEEQAALHAEARGRALKENPTLLSADASPDELVHGYMREIWEERQAGR